MRGSFPPEVPLLALSSLGVGMVAIRGALDDRFLFSFLVWNLLLAAIPWGCAVLMSGAVSRGWRSGWLLTIPAILFLPNAPYLVSDLVHFRPRPGVPTWFDALMLFSFATSGLWFGLLALRRAEEPLAAALGGALARVALVGACLISGPGVWMGRFLRFNSWDAVVNPAEVVLTTASLAVDHAPRAAGVALGYGLLLGLSHLILESVALEAQNRKVR